MGQGGSSSNLDKYATFSLEIKNHTSTPGGDVCGHVSVIVAERCQAGDVYCTISCDLMVATGLDRVDEKIWTVTKLCKRFESGVIMPGKYQFPFCFTIPRGSPCSIEFTKRPKQTGAEAKIVYTVSVAVKNHQAWFNNKKQLDTKIVQVNAGRGDPTAERYIVRRSVDLDYGYSFFRTFGKLSFMVLLDQSQYQAGDTASIQVFLQNDSNVDVSFQNIKLKDHIFLKARRSEKVYKQHQVFKLEPYNLRSSLESNGKNEQGRLYPFGVAHKTTKLVYNVTLPMNIDLQTVNNGSKNISITYKCILKFSPNSIFGDYVRVEIPINIGKYADPPTPTATSLDDSIVQDAIPVASPVNYDDLPPIPATLAKS